MAAVSDKTFFFTTVGAFALTSVAATGYTVLKAAGHAAASPQLFIAGIVAGIAVRFFTEIFLAGSGILCCPCSLGSRWRHLEVGALFAAGVGGYIPWRIGVENVLKVPHPFTYGLLAGAMLANFYKDAFVFVELCIYAIATERRNSARANQNRPAANVPPPAAALPPPQPPAPTVLSAEVNQLLAGETFSEDNFYQLCDLVLQQKLTVAMLPKLINHPLMVQIPAHRIYDLLLWANAADHATVLDVCRRKFSMWDGMVRACVRMDTKFEDAIAREETDTVTQMLGAKGLSSFCLHNQLRGLVLTQKPQLAQVITSNQAAFNRIPREKRNALFPEA